MSAPKRIQRKRTKGWTAKRLDDFVPGPREQQQMFAGVQL